MDEWVLGNRIDITTGHKSNRDNNPSIVQGDQPDRTFTRNQKRKHDEINHVQKVNILFYFDLILDVIIYLIIDFLKIFCYRF